ncbi:MAG: autotransporter domain-containing protein, partial [Opitutaceae bacterium]|nr:autotransporter domain-containing protein [Opitutaceae bacterium]
GPGTLTLAVPTAFTGAVVVRGALALDAGASLDTARSITLADGALFAGSLARASGRTLAGSGTLTGSLSLSGATLALEPGHGPFTIGGDLDFASSTLALGLFANGDDIISVAGSFTASGANTIDLSYGMSGTYTLRGLAALDGSVITIGGASQIGTGARQNAVSTASGGDLIIDFQADISRLLTWTGGSSALWNMADENWAGSGNTDQFASLDTVVFDGAADAANPANRLITLASGTVRVSGMTVSGDEDYTFGGAGGISSGTLIITEPDNPENLAGATGGLIKSGAGTLTFANAGANNFAGGIQLSGGAIVFDDGAQLGAVAAGGGDAGIAFAASATLAGAGTLGAVSVAPAATASFAVDAGRSLTLASGLAGAGAVEKTGGGLLALDGDGGHAGGFTVSGGTLAARGAALRGPVVNNAAVVLHEETADGAYAGSMTGSGVLLKTGAGRLALTGTIALDRVIIAGGGLGLVHAARLDAATAITLSRGVLLSGAGSFTTPAFTNAGAIRVGRAADPAGPHDVMTLHGNYSGSDGEIHLDMSLNAAGVMEYDRFIINGDAAGVTHVTLQERPSADRLDGDTGLLPAFGDMLSVTGSTAPGAFVPAGVVEFGGGQYAWDPAAGNGAGGWATLVIEPASAIASLDAAALIIGKAAFGSLENRLLAARQTAAPREKQFWLAGFQRHEKLSTLRYDLHDAAPRADADTQGIQTGLDWMQKFPEYTFVFGFFADYAKSDLHLPRRTTASSVNSAGGGLYAMWEMEKWHVHAILRNARETFDIAAARAGTLETRGYSWGGLLAAGRDFQSAAGWRLEPEARLSYQMHNISDVTDSVGRRYVVESADSLEALASVRLAREFVIGNGVTLTPHLRAGWTCDFDGAGRMRVSGELFRNDFGDGGALVDFGLAAMLGRGVSAHLGGAWFRSKSTEGAHISAGFALAW